MKSELKHGVREWRPKIASDFLHKPSECTAVTAGLQPDSCLYLCTLILPPNLELTEEALKLRQPEEFLTATFKMWVQIQVAK